MKSGVHYETGEEVCRCWGCETDPEENGYCAQHKVLGAMNDRRKAEVSR